MKKFASIALCAAMLLTLLAACGAKETAPETTLAPETTVAPETTLAPETEVAPETGDMDMPENTEMTELEQLVENIYANHADVELPLMTQVLDLADIDLVTYNTGLQSTDGITEIVVSEPMMGQPYSLILAKVQDSASAAEVAQKIYDSVDMRKWVCMEADTKIGGYTGDIAMFFMVSSDFVDTATTESMFAAFEAAVGTEVTEIG